MKPGQSNPGPTNSVDQHSHRAVKLDCEPARAQPEVTPAKPVEPAEPVRLVQLVQLVQLVETVGQAALPGTTAN